jgi:hypothetical protein
MFATITRLDSAVAIARSAVVVGIVVAAVVLRNAVVVMVVSRHRGRQRNSATDPNHGESDRDPRLRFGEHLGFLSGWLTYVTKLEMARSIAGPWLGH